MGFPSPVGEAVPAIQVPSAQENPSSDRERHRAQGSGPGRKSTALFSINQKSLGSPFGVFLFPGGGGVRCSSPLTTPIPTPPHPLTPPPLLSSDVPDARGLRERGDPQGIASVRPGLGPIREGRGLLTGPASKGQVPDPRSAFLLTKGAVQVNPMGYTTPRCID